MPSRSLGTLTLDLVAKTAGFTAGMTKAERSSQKWRRQVKKDLDIIATSFAAVGAGAVAGLGAIAANALSNAKELRTLSTLSNETAESFQKVAYAAGRFGVEQEKVADILKDTSDKVGDFLQTGGGALADYFENIAPAIGQTAEQFRNLSGKEALQLYVEGLEKANLSQSEMTFYMEAIASDATLLLPLLKNNGAELGRLSDQAERFGAVLDDTEVDQLLKVNQAIGELKGQFEGLSNQIVSASLPAINELVGLLSDPATLEAMSSLANAVVTAFTKATEAITTTLNVTKFLGEEAAVAFSGVGIAADDIGRLEREAVKLEKALEGGLGALNEKLTFFGRDGIVSYQTDEELQAELDKVKEAITSYYANQNNKPVITPVVETPTENGGTGGGAVAPTVISRKSLDALEAVKDAQADINKQAERIRESLLTEEEAIAESYASRRETILKNTEITGQAQTELLQRLEAERDDMLATTRDKLEAERAEEASKSALDAVRQSLLTEEEAIEESYSRRRDIVLANTEETGQAQIELLTKLDEQRNEKLAELEAQRQIAQLQNYETLFGGLASITKSFEGEQSKAYKALFALEKAAAIARSIVAIQTGIANAMSLPFPQNIGAAATVVGQTASIVSTIQSTNLTGSAHAGMMSVPETGSYYLKKGERVTTEKTSAKLDKTLDRVGGSGGGGDTVINLNVTGVQDEGGLKRSSAQVANQAARAVQSAKRTL